MNTVTLTGGGHGLSQDEAAIVASLFLLMSREVPGDTPTARIDMRTLLFSRTDAFSW